MDIIVNVTENWAIGCNGNLLYNIPADLKRFRELTLGRVVILGRKTLYTFPSNRPLKGRTNIILSRQTDLQIEGATVVNSISQLLFILRQYNSRDISVIGGESIYRELLPYCDKAFITRTYTRPQADSFFPNLDESARWRQTDISELYQFDNLTYRYITYTKV